MEVLNSTSLAHRFSIKMENSWLVLAFSLLAVLVFLSKLTNHSSRQKKKLPPGPKPWPIIGNLNLLGSIPHQSLHLLAEKYGDLMCLKFGSKPVLIASSPEMAKLFLRTHDNVFASRPPTASGKYTAYDYTDVTWAPYGPYWRHARRIYLNHIFNPKSLDSFEYLRVQERKAFLYGLYELSGKPFVLREHLSRYSVSSLSRMVMGNKYFSETKVIRDESICTLEKLQDMLDQWFLLNGVFNIGDWIPYLNRFDLQGYVKQMKELYKNFEIFNNHVLDDHLTKRNADKDNFIPKDMLDIILKIAEDPNLEIKLTRDNVKALLQELLVGGSDTSVTTVEWAMNELLRHPHLIKKATEELDRVIGRDRWVEEGDYSKLPFIEAIIKETMRIHPLATLLAPHYAIEDCNVAGYDVSEGTTVLINIWSMGRNPKYWDSPEEFLPERFLEKDIDVKGQNNFVLIPFGSGRRRCPGYTLGLRIVRATLANLLHGFNWKLPPGMKPEDVCVEELYGLTTRPKISLSVIVEPRLPLHLY
nr:WrBX4 [Wrightia religiosa]